MRTGFLAAATLAASFMATALHAQEFPTKPVTVVVAAPAGGGIDVSARLMADELNKKWGQPVIVDNRQGGGGNVGADVIARAQPDGYTILVSGPAPLTINSQIYDKLSFDPEVIRPVAILNSSPNAIVVSNQLGVSTIEELIAKAKAAPKSISFASQGIGTTPHLGGELLQDLAEIELTHVPYRGTAAAVTDVVAGHVDMMFMQLEAALRVSKEGSAKVIALTSAERVPEFPDLPTLVELGYTEFVSDTWTAVTAPPGTPDEIIATLNSAILEVLETDMIKERFENLGLRSVGGSPEDMARYLAEEKDRWGRVVEEAQIRVQE